MENRYHRQKNDNRSRIAAKISKRFQLMDSKYSGADDESITEYVIQYDLVDLYFSLSQPEKRILTQIIS